MHFSEDVRLILTNSELFDLCIIIIYGNQYYYIYKS